MIKTVPVTDADKRSAELFFNQLTSYFDTASWDVLDMFARTGDLTVVNYKDKVANVDCWELEAEHYDALAARGVRDIKIGCSYATALNCEDRYDMVVVDSPQGLHNDFDQVLRVEHFSAMFDAANLLKDSGILVLYVNKKPYNKDEVGTHGYDEYEEYDFNTWMMKREFFYMVGNGKDVTEADAIDAYTTHLAANGFKVDQVFMTPCYSDVEGLEPYAFRLGLKVTRTR